MPAVQGFQIISDRVHRSIVPRFRPIVKRVFGDLQRVSLIGLDLAERVVAVLGETSQAITFLF